MKKLLLLMSPIFLTAVVSGCGFDIFKSTPTFLDPVRGYGRVYKARPIPNVKCGDPDYEFYYSQSNVPIADMSAYVCVPVDQAQAMLRSYNEWYRENQNCDEGNISDKIKFQKGYNGI